MSLRETQFLLSFAIPEGPHRKPVSAKMDASRRWQIAGNHRPELPLADSRGRAREKTLSSRVLGRSVGRCDAGKIFDSRRAVTAGNGAIEFITAR